jgi:hypothetical protein
MLAAQKNPSYIPFIARLETFIMFTHPATPAALRLHLVGMLGSDFNKDLDLVYCEFVALYGHKWEGLAAMSNDHESPPGEGNWEQFVIFRGFPVHQEGVFFSTLAHLSPTLDKCSAALVKLYKLFHIPSASPGRDTDAWHTHLNEIRSGHRTHHHSGIDTCDHLQHLISSIQERSPDECGYSSFRFSKTSLRGFCNRPKSGHVHFCVHLHEHLTRGCDFGHF